MTTEKPSPTWFVHEDAVDELAPMDISVRAKAGQDEIILCYMGPGLTGTVEDARAHARLIAKLLNELSEQPH